MAVLPLLSHADTNGAFQVLAQFRSAGAGQLAGATNLVTLNRIRALPSTAALRKLAFGKVSSLMAAALGFDANSPAKSFLGDLLPDLLQSESLGSFGGSSTNALDFVLALRLDTNRAQVWQDNISKMLGGDGEKFTSEGFAGRRWTKDASRPFWIVPARDWLLVGHGDALAPLGTQYLQELSRQGNPGPSLKENLLEADVDLPGLAPWLPDWPRAFKPARIKISVAIEGDNLLTSAHIIYPEPIAWNTRPWQIPDGLVRSPLLSFTAGQDVAAFLNPAPAFSRIDNNPLTNQFYAWAQGAVGFESYLAWPVPNASNALRTLSTQAPDAFNPALKQSHRGEFVWLPKLDRLVLSNHSIFAPFVEAASSTNSQFLLLSLLPISLANKPAPDELWAQVKGRGDLVYYDWEETGPRLQQWRLLSGMLLHPSPAGNDDSLDANIVKENWLNAIGAPKGNTVTQITRVAPGELSLLRTSPFGLTGIEMVLLSDWISSSPLPPK